ncbi:STE3-domain-containing protein [Pluteus cervinus]|uniref:STE3-domain-containing protein n=1 Tax=Pluteus cervinus TaxID=181527 RepID=A0ACD3ANM7_9AGAR|nr:STE3-domain-containing protein [Pluteus cervinus]
MSLQFLQDYYPNSIFSIFSFLGFVACTIPLPWHLEAWNTGMCLYMVWTGLGCLILFINSIVWHHNAINWSPIWCDITARYIVGLNSAIPATCLAITRRLYHITAIRIPASKVDNRRAMIVDIAIGLGIPFLEMVLQYIPQGHRFNIFEDIGCWPFTYGTTVGLVFVFLPPIALCLISGVYAVLGIRSFWKSRADIDEILSGMGHRNLTPSRYIRLLCFSTLGVLITIPLALYDLGLNLHIGNMQPWTGWRATHADFQRVDQFPAIIWKSQSFLVTPLEISRWSVVGSAFLFFVFFSFADEAIKKYRSALRAVSMNIGLSTDTGDTFTPLASSTLSSSTVSLKVDVETSFPPIAMTSPDYVMDISPIRPRPHTTRPHVLVAPPLACPSNGFTAIKMPPLARTNVYQIV